MLVKKSLILIFIMLLVVMCVQACAAPEPAPSPAPTPQPTPAPTVEPITIKWASFQTPNQIQMVHFIEGFIEGSTKASNGQLVFDFKGGPETFPPFDLGKAVQSGVVDIGLAPLAFYEALTPGTGGAMLRQVSLDELRKPGGAYDFLVELHKPAGLTYLGLQTPTEDLAYFQLYLNKKVETPEDFKKIKIGTTAGVRAATEGWGAATVSLAIGDYYTAMERGTVDGVSSAPITQWVASGCQSVTKYMIEQGYYDSTSAVFMNLDTWNKIPADLQKVMTQAMIESEKYCMGLELESRAVDKQKLVDAGVEIYKLSPDTAKWFIDTAYDAAWKAQEARFPEATAKLKALISK